MAGNLIGGDDSLVNAGVELLDDVTARVGGQFAVEDAGGHAELAEEHAQFVAPADVSHKNYGLAREEVILEDVEEEHGLLKLLQLQKKKKYIYVYK